MSARKIATAASNSSALNSTSSSAIPNSVIGKRHHQAAQGLYIRIHIILMCNDFCFVDTTNDEQLARALQEEEENMPGPTTSSTSSSSLHGVQSPKRVPEKINLNRFMQECNKNEKVIKLTCCCVTYKPKGTSEEELIKSLDGVEGVMVAIIMVFDYDEPLAKRINGTDSKFVSHDPIDLTNPVDAFQPVGFSASPYPAHKAYSGYWISGETEFKNYFQHFPEFQLPAGRKGCYVQSAFGSTFKGEDFTEDPNGFLKEYLKRFLRYCKAISPTAVANGFYSVKVEYLWNHDADKFIPILQFMSEMDKQKKGAAYSGPSTSSATTTPVKGGVNQATVN